MGVIFEGKEEIMSDNAIKTTIRTDQCTFSLLKIYPGRGQRYASLDGRVHTFINHRCKRLATVRGVKALKLKWSQQWRKANKKGIDMAVGKVQKKAKTKTNTKAALGLDISAIWKAVGK